jgi:dual specificity tyrosine-phosphorylation-regulated kinase 2/3/4
LDDELKLPISGAKVLRHYLKRSGLTEYEKSEVLDFKQIYFLGLGSEKINGSKFKQFNFGYDDDRGDYNVVLKDHISYRFEVIDFLGKGSFGQALKVFDHKTQEIVAIKIIRNKKKFQH